MRPKFRASAMFFFNIYQYKTSTKAAFLEDLFNILGIKNVRFRALKRIFQFNQCTFVRGVYHLSFCQQHVLFAVAIIINVTCRNNKNPNKFFKFTGETNTRCLQRMSQTYQSLKGSFSYH